MERIIPELWRIISTFQVPESVDPNQAAGAIMILTMGSGSAPFVCRDESEAKQVRLSAIGVLLRELDSDQED